MSSKKKHNKAAKASLGTKANPGDAKLAEEREAKRAARDIARRERERAAAGPAPANPSRRFFAYLVDWYFGALCSCLPVFVASSFLIGDMTNQNLLELPAPWGVVAGIAGVILACCYYVLFPLLVWEGQTPGKRLCRIKIVDRATGEKAELLALLLRQILGIVVLEGTIAGASAMWHQVVTTITRVNVVTPLMYVGFALTLASSVMILVRKDRRCIHDFLGSTIVVAAPRADEDDAADAPAPTENPLEKKLASALAKELKGTGSADDKDAE